MATTTLDSTALRDLRDRIRREVDDGRVPSGQLAVGHSGEVVHVECFGDAHDDSRFAVFSCTKAVVAAAVWQLLAEGSLSTDTPVVDLVPDFAAARGVTVQHLLTHTGGFPFAPLGPPQWDTREARLEQFRSWRLQWQPGERFEYHATTGHWVLAEMIEVVEGRDFREVVRNRVLAPLGIDDFVLGGEAAAGPIEELRLVGNLPTAADIEAAYGIPDVDIEALLGEVTPGILVHFNEPSIRVVGIPGGGGTSTAAALVRLYQAFLHDPEGMWDPAVLAEGTARVHCSLPDPMLGHPSNRTLGLVLAGDDGKSHLRGMGHTVSPAAFGHNGAAGQIAWADPATGLSFAFCTSGVELDFLREARRVTAIASRAGVLTNP